jgi:hypothetical protein
VFEAAPYERAIRDLSCLNAIAGTMLTIEVDLGILTVGDVELRRRLPPNRHDEPKGDP